MRFVFEQERQRIHIHRRHNLIEVRSRDGSEADGPIPNALHIGYGVAKLRIGICLDLHRAFGQKADFFCKILLCVAGWMFDRLNAGIFGDNLRVCRRDGRKKGNRSEC